METVRIYSKPLKLTIFFGRAVHWATGKLTDIKGASDNEAFVENQTQFLIV